MKPLKIDVLANDGSPLGVSEQSIYGHDGRLGVGGAELAILTLMRGWHDAGHEVRFYNNPKSAHGSAFRHLSISLFNPSEDRDVLIIFRSPNRKALHATGRKIWFSTDQYTVGDFPDFSTKVDKIITISKFHADYFRDKYGITNTTIIDLPVRVWEYSKQIEKVKNRIIFCSVPDRGLGVLADCYDELKQRVPDLSLVITSDYRLWGAGSPLNEQYMRRFLGKSGVTFLGAVTREKLIEEQLRAEVHAYPCIYDELFCYAVAECQVAGAFPITSSFGALGTTNMGMIIPGNPITQEWKRGFIDSIVEALHNKSDYNARAIDVQSKARDRFSLEKILGEWDKVLNG